MFIIFDELVAFCSCPDCLATSNVEDDITKQSTFEEEMVDCGVKEEDVTVGKTADSLFPFVFVAFDSPLFSFSILLHSNTSPSPNSVKGRTGNK